MLLASTASCPSSGKTYYYLEIHRKTIALGSDRIAALEKYCQLVKTAERPAKSWLELVRRYQTEALPKKAVKTQTDELSRMKRLNAFFAEADDLEKITAGSLKAYKAWRIADMAAREKARLAEGRPPSRRGDGKVAVNRELTLFTTIWNFARNEKEWTKLTCPAEGVERFKERGRKDVYIEDDILKAVYDAGDQSLRDVLDLAYLTGQRRADVLAMTESMLKLATVRNGDGSKEEVRTIPVKQEKTGNKVRMIVDGELALLIDRIASEKKAKARADAGNVISLSLLTDEKGHRLTAQMLRGRFEKAREAAAKGAEEAGAAEMARDIRNFQFRDLRAKAGSDKAESTGSMLEAQKLLGHSAASTTEIYVRHRRGALVRPTR